MMRSPAAVRDFLLEFAEVVKPKAQAEVETLRRLKAEHEGTKFEDTTISRREVFQYKGRRKRLKPAAGCSLCHVLQQVLI